MSTAALLAALPPAADNGGSSDGVMLSVLILLPLLMVIGVIVGCIMLIPKQTRTAGAWLAGLCGVGLIVTFGVCVAILNGAST